MGFKATLRPFARDKGEARRASPDRPHGLAGEVSLLSPLGLGVLRY